MWYWIVFTLLLVSSPQDDWRGLLNKAKSADEAGNYQEAKKLLDTAIKVDQKRSELFSLRGGVHFKLANVTESLSDFDQQIILKPGDAAAHWRRGLTLYYAEKFPDGVAQFRTSDKAEPNDVENAVWHMLCNAKVKGVDAARKDLLKVRDDTRIPMMEIYALFAGKSSIKKVLAQAEGAKSFDDEELKGYHFYAHLYSGLYAEMTGDSDRALELINIAVRKYPIKHYMKNVAEVHLKLRK